MKVTRNATDQSEPAYIATAPNRLLKEIRFRAGQMPQHHQAGSWSQPEADFTWALTPGCSIRTRLKPSNNDLAVFIDVMPAILPPDRPTRRMSVRYKNTAVLDVEFAERSTFLIPLGLLVGGGTIELDFAFDAAVTGMPGETRPLAVAFRSLRVIALGSNPTQNGAAAPSLPAIDLASARKLVQASTGMTIETFLTTFESLGHSCDFGIFQREVGAEPLGLLRFSGITTAGLIDGLLDRFDRLGVPGTMEASVVPEWGGEYATFDRVYSILSHTFLKPDTASPEQVIARECWRLPFLRRLFLEVLDQGSKTFVLRRPAPMHAAEALAVAEALRLHGDNKLLWAVQGQGGEPGATDILAPYVVRGHLDRADLQSWLSICTNARALFDGMDASRDMIPPSTPANLLNWTASLGSTLARF